MGISLTWENNYLPTLAMTGVVKNLKFHRSSAAERTTGGGGGRLNIFIWLERPNLLLRINLARQQFSILKPHTSISITQLFLSWHETRKRLPLAALKTTEEDEKGNTGSNCLPCCC